MKKHINKGIPITNLQNDNCRLDLRLLIEEVLGRK